MKARLGIGLVLVAVCSLALAGCGSSATAGTPTQAGTVGGTTGATPTLEVTVGDTTGGKPTLEGTEWKLVSYVTAQNGMADLLPDTGITTLFNRGDLSGEGTCNSLAGTYTVNGERLLVKGGGTTDNLCAQEVMGQEKIFLGDLNLAASYKISGNQLQIFDDGGLLLLTYTR
jgi:heat shock protein HslJ